jgi:hypothetical protein
VGCVAIIDRFDHLAYYSDAITGTDSKLFKLQVYSALDYVFW